MFCVFKSNFVLSLELLKLQHSDVVLFPLEIFLLYQYIYKRNIVNFAKYSHFNILHFAPFRYNSPMQLSELLKLSREFLSRSHNLKKDDILPLREVIQEHNRLYHIEEHPIISDTEYDILFHALARLESDHDMLDESSPTAKLAILASEQFQKVKHMYPMISLDNTYTLDEVRDFEQRMRNILKDQSPNNFPYYIQPKYDGLGLAVIYKYGKLEQAITR